jgi:hypothetical protein
LVIAECFQPITASGLDVIFELKIDISPHIYFKDSKNQNLYTEKEKFRFILLASVCVESRFAQRKDLFTGRLASITHKRMLQTRPVTPEIIINNTWCHRPGVFDVT